MKYPRFIGMEFITVDDKNRLTLPARYSSVLREMQPDAPTSLGMMLTRNRTIKLMPLVVFNEMVDHWENLDDHYDDERELILAGPATAEEVELDKQNRLKLNPALMSLCHIERKAVIAGGMQFMQVMTEANFERLFIRRETEYEKTLTRSRPDADAAARDR